MSNLLTNLTKKALFNRIKRNILSTKYPNHTPKSTKKFGCLKQCHNKTRSKSVRNWEIMWRGVSSKFFKDLR